MEKLEIIEALKIGDFDTAVDLTENVALKATYMEFQSAKRRNIITTIEEYRLLYWFAKEILNMLE